MDNEDYPRRMIFIGPLVEMYWLMNDVLNDVKYDWPRRFRHVQQAFYTQDLPSVAVYERGQPHPKSTPIDPPIGTEDEALYTVVRR